MNEDFNLPEPEARPLQRLTAAQTAAARARVEECRGGFTYWTPRHIAPIYTTRGDAEAASIQEWRDNL